MIGIAIQLLGDSTTSAGDDAEGRDVIYRKVAQPGEANERPVPRPDSPRFTFDFSEKNRGMLGGGSRHLGRWTKSESMR